MLREEKIKFAESKSFFAGIDVAKRKHFAQVLDSHGKRVIKGLGFHNDQQGFLRLEEKLSQIQGFDHNVLFGFEPCSDYWKPLAYYLKGKGYPVALVNPYHLKRTREVIDNSQNKTDFKDAYLIADLCKQGKYFSPILVEGVYAELREVAYLWRRLTKNLVRNRIYLISLLDKFFPERKGCFYQLLGKSSFHLLKVAPFPQDILKLGKRRIVKELKEVSRGKIDETKTDHLYKLANSSIGIKKGVKIAKISLENLLSEIEITKEQLQEVKKLMSKLLEKTPYKEYLLSIPGVGEVTASIFLGEIGDPKKYNSPGQIEKLAGFNLVENSSGEKRSRRKISRRGRAGLRHVAYLIANVAIAKNKEIKSLYQYKVNVKKQEKMKALTAVAAKMLRIMFILCKKKEYYNPEEIKNISFKKEDKKSRMTPVKTSIRALY